MASGDGTCFCSSSCQLMSAKKGWFLISKTPNGPDPKRSWGLRTNTPRINRCASLETYGGNTISAYMTQSDGDGDGGGDGDGDGDGDGNPWYNFR